MRLSCPKRLSTGKTVSKNHIFKRMSDEKISELKTRWMKKHTFNNKMQWSVRAYNAWRTEKIKK